MKQLTVKQYMDAIRHEVLTHKQIVTLQVLYNQPNASATSKELARLIHPSNPSMIISNGSIGKIGKAIAKYCNVSPEDYYNGRIIRPSYFTVISKIYDQKTGWTMYKNLQKALENLGLISKTNRDIAERLTTEILPFEETRLIKEGKVVPVLVDRFERKQKARIQCLNHHGVICKICDFDFEKEYGEIASSYIHVHHLKQLSEIRKEYEVDPIKDLVPVCPNCHAVIHMTRPMKTIEEVKKLIKNARGN